ncbi:adenosylmethionine--8-amino-7-oxononanoate transaminase [Anatilimnocola floriformis]|uniref:adenosylmethionine--8-amino-7-oxononanoate transaminase n=1 Tax=Anatilimnocola floriformis TaxID=2948575 RepID=UPI0020C2440F|nr:adenosylmethionine--8-amino-7-oxononanoate transaminase [Anatilimnocola floriformis]
MVKPDPPTAEQLAAWDRELVWHAFTQMAEHEPLLIERAEGCTLYDVDGRALLDGVSSLWCNVHGHRHPHIDAAIRAQLDKVAHVTLLGMAHPTTVQLARKLVDIAPAGLQHVFFSDSGASAVEVALKMAFQYWQQCADSNLTGPQPKKTKYLAFDNAYHGDTLGSVSVGGVARFHEMFRPLLFEVLRIPTPRLFRLAAGVTRETAARYFLECVELLLQERHEEIAAIVIEPLMQCAAGMILHPPGFLRGVRELATKYNVLLIADEVAVGMGRTGKMFACENEGVEPDLLCLAKGLTGGYLPLAATLATDRIWQAFLGSYESSRTFFHGHTYGGNPLGAAAAVATLEVFENEQTLANLQPKIARLTEHLQRIAQLPHVGDIRQLGFIAGIELVRSRTTNEAFPWSERRGQQVCNHALTRGVWLRPLGNVVVILPPLSVTLAELDQICLAVEEGIRQIN